MLSVVVSAVSVVSVLVLVEASAPVLMPVSVVLAAEGSRVELSDRVVSLPVDGSPEIGLVVGVAESDDVPVAEPVALASSPEVELPVVGSVGLVVVELPVPVPGSPAPVPRSSPQAAASTSTHATRFTIRPLISSILHPRSTQDAAVRRRRQVAQRAAARRSGSMAR